MNPGETDLAPSTLFLLWAARETGALEALASDADTPAEVAESAGVTERAAGLVVDALTERGFLTEVEGAHEPTNRMLGFLAAADLRSVGQVPAALDAADALAALPETMRTGEPSGTDLAHDEDLTHRLGARAAMDDATVRAVTTAAVRQAPDADSVLDVGGAPGHYARAFAGLGRAVTLADDADAVERSTPLLASTPVETAAVAPLAAGESLPDADLAFAGDVARRCDPEEAGRLVRRLAGAAAPGGTVVLADHVAGRSGRAVPAAVTAFARDGGAVHDEAAFADWFEAAGLDDPEVRDVPGTERQVVVGDYV